MMGVQDQELSFIVIDFKLVSCHPIINVKDTTWNNYSGSPAHDR